MKLLKRTMPTGHVEYGGIRPTKEYVSIALETIDEVLYYKQVNEQLLSRQAIDFWVGLKSQPSNFVRHAIDYATHQLESDNGIGWALSFKLDLADKPTSIVEYCQNSDNIINGIHNSMIKYITNGSFVSVNEVGGFCPIQDYNEYDSVEEINEQEMYNFVVYKDAKAEFKITAQTIVLENKSRIPQELVEEFAKLSNIDKNDIQVITSFKRKTRLFRTVDYKTFFINGLNTGLKNIVFETYAQDVKQINELTNIFESVMFRPDNKTKNLNIYIKVQERHRGLFKTDAENIKIIFLNQ